MESLSVLFSPGCEEVRNAIWSSNRFLAARQHNGLSCEIGLTHVLSRMQKGEPQDWKKAINRIEAFYFRNSPGFQKFPYKYKPSRKK
jgi:hypothetical protein